MRELLEPSEPSEPRKQKPNVKEYKVPAAKVQRQQTWLEQKRGAEGWECCGIAVGSSHKKRAVKGTNEQGSGNQEASCKQPGEQRTFKCHPHVVDCATGAGGCLGGVGGCLKDCFTELFQCTKIICLGCTVGCADQCVVGSRTHAKNVIDQRNSEAKAVDARNA